MNPKMMQLLVAAILTNAYHYPADPSSNSKTAGEDATILSFERWYLFIGAAMADTATFTPPPASTQPNPLAGMTGDPTQLQNLANILKPLLGLAGPAGAVVGAALNALPPIAAPGVTSGSATPAK